MIRALALVAVLSAAHAFAAFPLWVRLSPPGADAPIGYRIAVDPSTPGTIYAAATPLGNVYKSTNGGLTWTALPLRAELIKRIVVQARRPNNLLVFSVNSPQQAIHYSSDGGRTWTTQRFEQPGLVWQFSADPEQPLVYMGMWQTCDWNGRNCIRDSGGVIVSSDYGRRWKQLLKGASVDEVAVDPIDGGTLVAVGATSWRSVDRGVTWTPLVAPDGAPFSHATFDPIVPGTIYASTAWKAWRSSDHGDHWDQLAMPFIHGGMWSISVSPVDPNIVAAAGSSGNGVAISRDGGRSWSAINEGLPTTAPNRPGWVPEVAFDGDGCLYAASDSGALKLTFPQPGPRRRSIRH